MVEPGKRIGKLVVLERDHSGRGYHSRWLCQCDCGNVKVVFGTHLVRGGTRSCGCLTRVTGGARHGWSGYGGVSGSLIGDIRRRAYGSRGRHKKIEFKLTAKYLWGLFKRQKGLCALSGVEIALPRKHHEGSTASVDRIDSAKGYVPGNVQWVHKDVNLMKNVLHQDRFIDMCRAVTAWCKKRRRA